MRFEINPAPERSSCTVDTDPGSLEPTPCGKPAVITITFEGDPDEPLLVCEDCRIRRNQNTHRHAQAEAFEAQHGYPPNLGINGLAWRLGNRLERHEKLLELNAPVLILRGSRDLLKRTETQVWNWLAAHEPEGGSHLAALNDWLHDVKASTDADEKTLLEGLRAARRIACALVIERAIKNRPAE